MVHHYFVVPMPFSYEEPCFPTHLKNYFPFLSPWTTHQLDKMYGNGTPGQRTTSDQPQQPSISKLEQSVHSTLSQLSFPQLPPTFQLNNLQCPTVSVEFKRENGVTLYSMAVPLGAHSNHVQVEDLKLTIKDNVITVDGMKKEKKSGGSSSSSSQTQTGLIFEKFTKKVTLPPNVNLNKVKVHFSASKGCLRIEAPLVQQTAADVQPPCFNHSNISGYGFGTGLRLDKPSHHIEIEKLNSKVNERSV